MESRYPDPELCDRCQRGRWRVDEKTGELVSTEEQPTPLEPLKSVPPPKIYTGQYA